MRLSDDCLKCVFEIVAEITGKETKEDSVWINIIARARE